MTTSQWPRPALAHDDLGGWPSGSEQVPGFFDRFYFNLHGPTSPVPFVMVGSGRYPQAGVSDGYLIAVVDGQQRNLRFAGASAEREVGPLRWEVAEPFGQWHVAVGPNELGVELDVVWRARSAMWETRPVVLADGSGGTARFEHGFQSGRYEGELRIDGERFDVSGWLGQRDRSRGVRPVSGGQGLHLWVQAQMPDRTVSLMLDVDRDHRPTMLDGAVLPNGGVGDRIVAVEHDLTFTDDLEVTDGTMVVETAGGTRLELEIDGSLGGFLSGGGYGGWHGKHRDPIVESERWELDGSVTPRGLDTPLTDQPAVFRSRTDGVHGTGVFEFAHTRSTAYRYRAGRHLLSDVRPVSDGG